MASSTSSPVVAFVIASSVCMFFSCLISVSSQDQNVTTDPSEARTLNSIFNKWGKSALANVWNISGELCSGRAIDSTTQIDDLNPFIKCDCSGGTICHITALRVYKLDVVGEIPRELWTLTHLTNLDLRDNCLTGSLPPAIGNLTRMQYMSFGTNSLSGELPKELGNLIELLSLSVSSNNFSGSIPPELGNLVKLQQLVFVRKMMQATWDLATSSEERGVWLANPSKIMAKPSHSHQLSRDATRSLFWIISSS